MDSTNDVAMKPLRRRKLLYQAAIDEIKAYIIANRLKPGDLLPPEAQLVSQFGVSRNSVREAIKALENIGVLEARPGIGLVIRHFSFDPLLENLAYGLMFDARELHDIFEVRFQLEYSMAERAINTVTPEQLACLRDELEKMRLAAEAGRYDEQADRRFHRLLWENVNNAMLGKILDIFWIVHHEARRRESIGAPPILIESYQRHVAIAASLEKRDLAALQAAMKETYQSMMIRFERAKQPE